MSDELELKLLGDIQIYLDGQPLTGFRSRKALALLCYLAVTGRPHLRPALAGLLWGGLSRTGAQNGLRKALSELRHLVGPYLDIDRGSAAFLHERPHRLDVAELERACADTDVRRLEAAVELYRGDFLEGFYLRNAPEFEEWMLAQRARLRKLATQALHTLSTFHAERGLTGRATAIDYTARLLEMEPWLESAHRQMMTLLAAGGQRGAALAQYETCRQVLDQELGVEPEPETVDLYRRIRNGELTRIQVQEAPRPTPAPALPQPPTPFIGRQRELEIIAARLHEPDCRLLTLVGFGGVGKTRLALEAAAREQAHYRDGIVFVPLTPIGTPMSIAPAVAQALGITLQGTGTPIDQLARRLRDQELLLVLDNMEHLLAPSSGAGAGALISRLLNAAPGVTILTTSRVRLEVQGEHPFTVVGLDVPPATSEQEMAERYSAIALFMDSARRARPSYAPAGDDLAQIARICRLVEGMPLAVTLAAAWIEMLSPREIADQIQGGLDFLAADLQDLPERQRSMRTVCDASWQMLTQPEREVFARLSVFYDGFDLDAAEQVAGADLRILMQLLHKSFLERTPEGRYQTHELLRQYAEGELSRSPGDLVRARDAHCAYFVSLLQHWLPALEGGAQREAMAAVQTDLANAQAAWRWAIERGKVQALGQLIEPLNLFYQFQSRYLEAVGAFREAAQRLEQAAPGEQTDLALVRALVYWGWHCVRLGDLETAKVAMLRCRDVYRRLGLPPVRAFTSDPTLGLCSIAFIRGDYARAARLGEQARQTAQEHDHPSSHMMACYLLARTALVTGEYEQALDDARQAHALAQKTRNRWFMGYTSRTLGSVAMAMQDYARAQAYLERSYRLRQAFGVPEGGAWCSTNWATWPCSAETSPRRGRSTAKE